MATTRYVWRGRRRQKLRALLRALDRVQGHHDPHFKEAYRIFPGAGGALTFGVLHGRALTCLAMREEVPEAPAVTP